VEKVGRGPGQNPPEDDMSCFTDGSDNFTNHFASLLIYLRADFINFDD